MKIKLSPKRAWSSLFSLAAVLIATVIFCTIADTPLHAGLWESIDETLSLKRLIGKGEFIGFERNVDTKDRLFPLQVMNDGFKMVRVYQSFPGSYMTEWAWRATLKNRSTRTVEITFEYKLHDQDDFVVISSKEYSRKIAAGETVILEKKDDMPLAEAKRIMKSSWYVHLQN